MTREVEMKKAASQYVSKEAEHSDYPKWDDVEMAFQQGMKYADQHPVYLNRQPGKGQDQEAAFVKDWRGRHPRERPTYADAIAWAEDRVIKKAIDWLLRKAKDYTKVSDTKILCDSFRLIMDFENAMKK